MWAMQAVRVGYKWSVGNGKSIRFWEDIWHGNAPLATQFWDLYFLVNEKIRLLLICGMGRSLNVRSGERLLMSL